jgi:hypothetical protein
LTWLGLTKKIREIINQIKMSEAEIATRQIKVEMAAPEFSVAS